MMKRIVGLIAVAVLISAWGTATGAESRFYEGEGYIVPSEKASEAYTPLRQKRQGRTTINIVTDGFPENEVFVTVLDENGNPVTGLTAADFVLTERSENEAVPVQETLTCFEEITAGNGISISLAFDLSTSMNIDNRLTDAKQAAIDFLNTTNPDDRASIVSFSGCGEGGIDFPVDGVRTDANSNGAPDINETINGLDVIGLTSLYDGIGNAIDSIINEPFPKGVIVFTDGNTNNDCIYTINQVIQKAVGAGIPVYTIGLAIDAGSMLEQNLQLIATQTGGTYTAAPTAADMAQIYADVAQNIRTQYRLCYTSHNPDMDGTTREVAVTANNETGTGTYTVGDTPTPMNNPPVIVHTPVTTANENQPVTIAADVTDPDVGDSVNQVSLFYRPAGGDPDAPYTEVPMTNVAGDTYQAVIPGDQVTLADIEYYIAATDTNNAQTTSASAASPYFIDVTPTGTVNQPPVANAGPDQSANEGAVVTLDGSASTDPDAGDTLTYLWQQTGGPTVTLSDPNAVQPQLTAPAVGPAGDTLTFRLMVTDAAGLSSMDTVEIVVNDALAPTAAFTWTPQVQFALDPVSFTDQSTPNGSPIVAWAWDFAGLGSSTDRNPTFTFPEQGSYPVRLTVTDASGSFGTIIQTVTIDQERCLVQECGGGSGGCFAGTLLP